MTDERDIRINDLEEKIRDLEDDLADERADLKAQGAELEEALQLTEQECIRCHTKFTGHPDQTHCTRDCQMGWTPAPRYEDWYRTMHPSSPWLQPSR